VPAWLAILSAVEPEAEAAGRGLVGEVAGALVSAEDLGDTLDDPALAVLLAASLALHPM